MNTENSKLTPLWKRKLGFWFFMIFIPSLCIGGLVVLILKTIKGFHSDPSIVVVCILYFILLLFLMCFSFAMYWDNDSVYSRSTFRYLLFWRKE
jgi:hypothetical protein